MKLIKAAERLREDSKPAVGRFHGQPVQQTIHEADTPARVSFIRFEPGAHTMWHEHSGGQVLHIVEGRARVCAWGEKTRDLAAGDTAIAPPGEKHWHGAGHNAAMMQLAITCGEVAWHEDVED